MSGVKGRSGRRKTRKHEIEDAFETVRGRMPEFFQSLADQAVGIYVVIPGKDGESVRAYQKPPDKECAMYLIDREYGKPRISLDQRLTSSVDVTLDPSRLLAAMRERELIEAQYHLVSEREPSNPTRELSHAPVSDTPFREETISQNQRSANSTDSVGIPNPDHDVSGDCCGGWLDGAGI